MDYGHTRFLFGLLLIIFLLRVRPILLCSERSIEPEGPDTLWTEYWIPFLVSVTTLCWAWRSVLSVATLKNQILQCCKKEHDDVILAWTYFLFHYNTDTYLLRLFLINRLKCTCSSLGKQLIKASWNWKERYISAIFHSWFKVQTQKQ